MVLQPSIRTGDEDEHKMMIMMMISCRICIKIDAHKYSLQPTALYMNSRTART